jgi:DNA-binding transcriptional ArsR family regulator/uncharacterized glyoxalase superfamily protein PhnB
MTFFIGAGLWRRLDNSFQICQLFGLMERTNELATLLRTLGDPTRLRVVELLSAAPRRAGELANAVGLDAPAMSRHLRALLEAGVVVDERRREDARLRIFRLRGESVGAVQAWLDQIQAHWAEQLGSFKAHVDGETEDAEAARERSITTQVEVAVDAATAFRAFTEELDLWWVRGPINHFDGGRTLAMRCEPGVGGRLLEVYDDAAGDALELARITDWQPGVLLAFRSSVDDVHTEVRFEPTAHGTLVRVTARIPADGEDRGGTAWTRVVVKWFGPWCARRERAPHEVRDLARLGLAISYARPAAAARWLAETFEFASPDPLPEGQDPLPDGSHGHPWIEFRIGTSSLVIFPLADATASHNPIIVPWVYVDDVGVHYRHAVDHGARVIRELASPWGLPFYVADDLEGNRWTFAQARPTMV